MVVVAAVIAIVSAIAVPNIIGMLDAMRLGQAAREVERELQAAKLKSVSAHRPVRVRFNCPAAGQFRIVELIGSASLPDAADGTASRCAEADFPYPAADQDPVTRPNLDGPLRRLDSRVSFGDVRTLEFWPDGTAHHDTGAGNPWPVVPADGISLTLTHRYSTATIRVNGLGRIELQQ